MGKKNFTNLAETYMYRKSSDKVNFYKYYKNDENSIDDPIFTGFTFDIDELHSPLFFTGESDEYITAETLRSSGGNNTSLADVIENRLTRIYKYNVAGAPDTYEINTLSAKDLISTMENTAGYGLQDKFYIDNVLYGATDYIYMVDKVTTGMYSDDIGAGKVGNGTPDSSVYDTYAEALDEAVASAYPDLENGYVDEEVGLAAVSNRQEQLNTELDKPAVQNEHAANLNAYNTLEEQYNDAFKGEDGVSLDDMEKNLKEKESKSNEEWNEALSKLGDIQEKARKNLERLRSFSGDEANNTEIEQNYLDFGEFFGNSGTISCSTIDIKTTTTEQNQNYEKWKNDVTDEEYTTSSDKFNKIWEILNAQLCGYDVKDGVKEEISNLKSQVKAKQIQLYGTDDNGNPCTQFNPSENSLLGRKNAAENTLNNDKYSQLSNEIQTLDGTRENIKDTLEYKKITENMTVTRKLLPELPTIDIDNATDEQIAAYQMETAKIRNTRQKYEVPQTVYDMLGFISGMKKLTREYPYVMQQVTGLDEAYKKYFNTKEPYQGSGDDKITISCYESLDLRVSSMFNKYFNAVYDHQYKRERVPVNLRRFECSIFVHDIRNFRHSLGLTKKFKEYKYGDNAISKIVEIALNYFSAVEFKFYDCEIVPEETGSIFDNVSDETGGEMKKTNFTFTYGNCVINFLPFADLQKYYQKNYTVIRENLDIPGMKDVEARLQGKAVTQSELSDKQKTPTPIYTSKDLGTTYPDDYELYRQYKEEMSSADSGDFRRWFDKSPLGNVTNNDYRDYIRHDSSVAVDDFYKTSIVNNFAMNSVVNKNKELTQMDDALRKIIVGISASTGIPAKGVADALNIGDIYEYINKNEMTALPALKEIGNVMNSKVVDVKTMEYIGKVIRTDPEELDIIKDLGKV